MNTVTLRREDWEAIQGYLKGIEVKLAQPPDRISKIRIRDYAILRLSVLRLVKECLTIKPVEEGDRLISKEKFIRKVYAIESEECGKDYVCKGSKSEEKCVHCGWPLKEKIEEGCVKGNCSMRPVPNKKLCEHDKGESWFSYIPSGEESILKSYSPICPFCPKPEERSPEEIGRDIAEKFIKCRESECYGDSPCQDCAELIKLVAEAIKAERNRGGGK